MCCKRKKTMMIIGAGIAGAIIGTLVTIGVASRSDKTNICKSVKKKARGVIKKAENLID